VAPEWRCGTVSLGGLFLPVFGEIGDEPDALARPLSHSRVLKQEINDFDDCRF
jgi:hypothetical protein